MEPRSSIYAAMRIGSRGRRSLVALTAAAAVLLGLAAPALASTGHHAKAAANTAGRVHAHGATFHPLVNTLSGGSISGNVTFPIGSNPYVDHSVVVRDGQSTWAAPVDRMTGDYLVSGLPTGSYRVTFNRVSGYADAAAQFYDGQDESAGVSGVTRVPVTAGATTPNIDATLRAGAHLTGRVVNASGTPLNCRVQAFTTDGSRVTRAGDTYNASGAFDIGGLTTGGYYLRVLNGGQCLQGTRYLGGDGTLTATGSGAARSVSQGAVMSLGTLVYPSGVLNPPPAPPVVVPPAPSPTPPPVFALNHKPKVTGPAKVGEKVKVKAASLSPAPSKVTYQWKLNGKPIKHAKHQSLTIPASAAGKKLSVQITYLRPGYAPLVVTTKVGRVHAPPSDRVTSRVLVAWS